jgi:hypothetical protein
MARLEIGGQAGGKIPEAGEATQEAVVVQFEYPQGWRSWLPCGKIESMTRRTFTRLTIVHDAHPCGVCADCGAKFVGLDEVIHRKFKEHKCNVDASQAAARIVREAPENH